MISQPRTRRSRLWSARHLVPMLMLALVLGACSGGSESEPRLTVVATTTILGDIVGNIVQDDAEVDVLMPLGADPHDFRPSSAQVAAINSADLVVANGLLLEEGLEDVLEAAEADGTIVLEIGPAVDPLPFAGGSHHDEHEGEHPDDESEHDEEEDGDHDDESAHDEEGEQDAHGDEDPHVWLDLLRVRDAAGAIAETLASIDPEVDWQSRADAYAEELTDADARIVALLEPIDDERRLLVTNHDALGYFAERYGFEIVGTVIPSGSELSNPSSEDLASLIEVMMDEGVTTIFAETTLPTDLADAVAAELGTDVTVVELYTGSLGEPGSGAETLVDLVTLNAQRIASALAG